MMKIVHLLEDNVFEMSYNGNLPFSCERRYLQNMITILMEK